MDNCNKLKNMCSKEIGRKKKNKEPEGDSDTLPDDLIQKLDNLTADDLMVRSNGNRKMRMEILISTLSGSSLILLYTSLCNYECLCITMYINIK